MVLRPKSLIIWSPKSPRFFDAPQSEVMNVLSRHAKAPVSEFGAPSGARNFQALLCGLWRGPRP